MVKEEKTGQRDLVYSTWHRTLGRDFFAIDIDFVEFRHNRGIVAFFGVTGRFNDEQHIINSKQIVWQRTEFERKILFLHSEKFCVPAYYVFYTKDLNVFHVHNLGENLEKFKSMNKEQYADFIKRL